MTTLREMKPFWMVHGVGNAEPRVRHETLAWAQTEADRLARSNPGTTFVVLQAIGAVRKNDLERVRIGPGGGFQTDDDIPF